MALKDILLYKRDFYQAQSSSGKGKKTFYRAKNSLIIGEAPLVSSEELL
jgi:hypothetical protein